MATRAPARRPDDSDDSEIGADTVVEVERPASATDDRTPGIVRETYVSNVEAPQQHRALVETADGMLDTAVDRLCVVDDHRADLVRSVIDDA